MKSIIVIGALLCVVGALPAASQQLPRKKLIEYGWDVPYPEFVKQHIREMEQKPFDGIIFRVHDYSNAFDTRRSEGGSVPLSVLVLGAVSAYELAAPRPHVLYSSRYRL